MEKRIQECMQSGNKAEDIRALKEKENKLKVEFEEIDQVYQSKEKAEAHKQKLNQKQK